MLHWMRWILAVFVLALIAISVARNPFWLPSCQRAIVIDYVDDTETIMDYRTYIYLQRKTMPINQSLHHGAYHIEYDYLSAGTKIYVQSNHDDSSRLLYAAPSFAAAFLSEDQESYYLYDYRFEGETLYPVRLVRMDFESDEILDDYGNQAGIETVSPDRSSIYLSVLNSESNMLEMAAIDSNTGIVTHFHRPYRYIDRWSSDNRWFSTQNREEFEIVDAKTGENHPLLNQVFSGFIDEWTENGIWIQRNAGNGYDYWFASLDDGSVTLQYEHVTGLRRSDDERWRAIFRRENGITAMQLHDSLTDSYYSISEANVAWYFSDDGRCLLAGAIPANNPQAAKFVIYDLKTMLPIHTNYSFGVLSYSLYEGD